MFHAVYYRDSKEQYNADCLATSTVNVLTREMKFLLLSQLHWRHYYIHMLHSSLYIVVVYCRRNHPLWRSFNQGFNTTTPLHNKRAYRLPPIWRPHSFNVMTSFDGPAHDVWPNRMGDPPGPPRVIAWMPGASIPPGSDGESPRIPIRTLGVRMGHQTLFLVSGDDCIKRQHRFALHESLLRRSKRREKRYDCTLRLRDFATAATGSRRRRKTARRWNRRWEMSADRRWTRRTANTKRTTQLLDCCIARDLKSDCNCLPIFTVSYLYQKFSGKINLAYIIVVLGHRLTRTSATLDFVRTSYWFCVYLLRLLYAVDIELGLGL